MKKNLEQFNDRILLIFNNLHTHSTVFYKSHTHELLKLGSEVRLVGDR